MAPLALGPFGVQELLLILVIVIVLFGARRIPELMKGLGQGVSSFKKGLRDDEKSDDGDATDTKGPTSS